MMSWIAREMVKEEDVLLWCQWGIHHMLDRLKDSSLSVRRAAISAISRFFRNGTSSRDYVLRRVALNTA